MRLATSSLVRIELTWLRTVIGEMTSSSAISEFVRPRATYSMTSRSRGDKPARTRAIGVEPAVPKLRGRTHHPSRLDDPHRGELPSHAWSDDRCRHDRNARDVEPHTARCRPDQIGNGDGEHEGQYAEQYGNDAWPLVSRRATKPLDDCRHAEKEREDQQGPDHDVDDAGPTLGEHPERVVQMGRSGRRIVRRHRSRDQGADRDDDQLKADHDAHDGPPGI